MASEKYFLIYSQKHVKDAAKTKSLIGKNELSARLQRRTYAEKMS
jgi:hypothetical protein